MRYRLRIPENLEELIHSWKLPAEIAEHLQRESVSSRLLEPPFEALHTVSSMANVYRWSVVSQSPHSVRLDFLLAVNSTQCCLEMIQAKCIHHLAEMPVVATDSTVSARTK